MISVRYGSKAEHNAQILTGINLLTNGQCEISNCEDSTLPPCIVLMEYNGKKIAFDTCDGYFHENAIATDCRYAQLGIEILFKRDFSKRDNEKIDCRCVSYVCKGGGQNMDLYPLGLNYYCYDRRIEKIYFYDWKRRIKHSIKKLCGMDFDAHWKNFENKKSRKKYSCDVLFLTRLWNPESEEVENPDIIQDRIEINQMRINIIKALREKYGDAAICGVYDDDYARKTVPELIVTSFTDKKKYINVMKNAKVVISSLGLHKSNGWKFGEYFAAGKAIVAEKPYYDVPYAEAQTNWLEYKTVDECLENVERLLSDSNKRKNMEQCNKSFYEKHGRPDRLIYDALQKTKWIEEWKQLEIGSKF